MHTKTQPEITITVRSDWDDRDTYQISYSVIDGVPTQSGGWPKKTYDIDGAKVAAVCLTSARHIAAAHRA